MNKIEKQKVINCPVCNSKQLKILKKKDTSAWPCNIKKGNPDYAVFTLKKCENCTFVFCSDPPFESGLTRYYENVKPESRTLITKAYKLLEFWLFSRRIRKYVKKGSEILDFGCGCGDLLRILQKEGYKAAGIDYSIKNILFAQKKYKLKRMYKTIEASNFLPEQFDAIVLRACLEHLIHPQKYLKKLTVLLKPKGYLFITVPNMNSQDFKKLGFNWGMICPPKHVNFFNKYSLALFLNKMGYKIIKITDSRIPSYTFPYNIHKSLSIPIKIIKLISVKFVPTKVQGSDLNIIAKKV